jgi:hypothetical protein
MHKGRRRNYGRGVKGFYTDEQGRVRPITWKRRGSFKVRINCEPMLGTIINSVLQQAPIFRELQSAYLVADAVCVNLDLIKKIYSSYQEGNLKRTMEGVGNDVLRDVLSSTQTNIVWLAIKDYIPRRYQNKSFSILSRVMEQVTDEEIKYVRRFLEQAK